MGRYIARRLMLGVVSLWLISLFVFGVMRMTGDPAAMLAGQQADDDDIQRVRVQYGLDKPIPVQYAIFVWKIFHGDLGVSVYYAGIPALRLYMERFPATVQLTVVAKVLALSAGVSLGVIAALRREGLVDRFGRVVAIAGQSMPVFWVGLLILLVFAVNLRWLPPAGGPREGLQHLILPAITVAWFSTAAHFRIARSAMLDVLGSDYIKMGRLKGLPRSRLIWRHALKNASLPILAIFSVQFAHTLTGAVVTETIFGWPGVGRLAVDAVLLRDFNVIQAVVLISAFWVILVYVLVDLLYVALDPRIRLGARKGLA